MEAQILEMAALDAIFTIGFWLVILLACCIVAYRNWGEHGELGTVKASFVIAMCAILFMFLAGIDLYKIKNYPLAYLNGKNIYQKDCK